MKTLALCLYIAKGEHAYNLPWEASYLGSLCLEIMQTKHLTEVY